MKDLDRIMVQINEDFDGRKPSQSELEEYLQSSKENFTGLEIIGAGNLLIALVRLILDIWEKVFPPKK